MSDNDDVMVVALTGHERGVLASLIRVAIRKRERALVDGAARFGNDWDPTRTQARLNLLTGLYGRLGGDPDRISRDRGRRRCSDGSSARP